MAFLVRNCFVCLEHNRARQSERLQPRVTARYVLSWGLRAQSAPRRAHGGVTAGVKNVSAKGKVLLVEDQDEVREALRFTLERAGYSVNEAVDGNAALISYRKDVAQVVVTDLAMPVMSGLELIAELCAEFPGVKVVAISKSETLLARVPQTPSICTLRKPFAPSELVAMIRALLGER